MKFLLHLQYTTNDNDKLLHTTLVQNDVYCRYVLIAACELWLKIIWLRRRWFTNNNNNNNSTSPLKIMKDKLISGTVWFCPKPYENRRRHSKRKIQFYVSFPLENIVNNSPSTILNSHWMLNVECKWIQLPRYTLHIKWQLKI